jgi:hypothetical protein
MDHRTILSTGFLLLCGSIFIHSLKSADASMPVGMQHGQFPYESFTECDISGASVSGSDCTPPVGIHTLLSVPSDRIFVVTGGEASYYSDCWFQKDGTLMYSRELVSRTDSRHSPTGPLKSGNAHITIAAGTDLQIEVNSTNCNFYLDGYYAHP